jgi:hypothetical protein
VIQVFAKPNSVLGQKRQFLQNRPKLVDLAFYEMPEVGQQKKNHSCGTGVKTIFYPGSLFPEQLVADNQS